MVSLEVPRTPWIMRLITLKSSRGDGTLGTGSGVMLSAIAGSDPQGFLGHRETQKPSSKFI